MLVSVQPDTGPSGEGLSGHAAVETTQLYALLSDDVTDAKIRAVR